MNQDKIRDEIIIAYKDILSEGQIDATINWFLSKLQEAIKENNKEIVKKVKSIKTRDNIGGFRHIEVYKQDIINLITYQSDGKSI